ncbi:MAG: hypothetical protein QW128_04100 [Thermoprotei archaeon]
MDNRIESLITKVSELSLRLQDISKSFDNINLNERMLFSRRKAFIIIVDRIKERVLKEIDEVHIKGGRPWVEIWKITTYIFIHGTDYPLSESIIITPEEFLTKIDQLKNSILNGEQDKNLYYTPEQLIYEYFSSQKS